MKNVTFIARLRAPNTPIPQKGKLIKSYENWYKEKEIIIKIPMTIEYK
jgi:hypothetical protein